MTTQDKTIPYDRGSAFPYSGDDFTNCYGMTLRDWFAGMALNGILSNTAVTMAISEANKQDANLTLQHAARRSYEFADGMIIERQKCQKP